MAGMGLKTGVFALGALALAGIGTFGAATLTAPKAGAEDAAPKVTKEDVLKSAEFGRPGDIVLGDADAPIEVIEYASTTCGHCASFKTRTFPSFKAAYVDTGVAKYTLREFPTAPVVLSASAFMLARCVDESRYYGLIDVIFKTQRSWAYVNSAEEGRGKLKAIARQAGVSEAQFEACLADDAEYQRIRAVQKQGTDVFGIRATPSLIVNGEMVQGFQTFDELAKVLDKYVPDDARDRVDAAKADLAAE
ncbi:MAG: thioredoxin domain-containing protein [Alphaproteobacteria bacterium]